MSIVLDENDLNSFIKYVDENLEEIINLKYGKFEDIAIRASNKANLTNKDLFDANARNGLMGVYDLGMEHMYNYLKREK